MKNEIQYQQLKYLKRVFEGINSGLKAGTHVAFVSILKLNNTDHLLIVVTLAG